MHCGRAVLAMNCVLASAESRRGRPLNSVVRLHQTVTNRTRPLMVATRQDIVWRNAGISFLAGVAAIFVPIAVLPHIEPQYFGLAELFSGAGALFVLYGAVRYLYGPRCPTCGLRWVSWALRHRSRWEWSAWLQSFTECPNCHLKSNGEQGAI